MNKSRLNVNVIKSWCQHSYHMTWKGAQHTCHVFRVGIANPQVTKFSCIMMCLGQLEKI